jgi:hypothetical protein
MADNVWSFDNARLVYATGTFCHWIQLDPSSLLPFLKSFVVKYNKGHQLKTWGVGGEIIRGAQRLPCPASFTRQAACLPVPLFLHSFLPSSAPNLVKSRGLIWISVDSGSSVRISADGTDLVVDLRYVLLIMSCRLDADKPDLVQVECKLTAKRKTPTVALKLQLPRGVELPPTRQRYSACKYNRF